MYNIYHDIEIKATSASIFNMISSVDGLNAWWTVASSVELQAGGQFRFYFSDEFDWKAEVISFRANEVLELKMTHADEDWTGTLLYFSIIKKLNGVNLLRFEHQNWQTNNDHFRRTSYCWALYLHKMKEILESQ